MATPTFERNDPKRSETPSRVTSSSATRVASPVVAPSSREMTSLRAGDVLLLSHPVEMPLTLEAGGVATHDVTIGRVNRHLALQVGDPVPPQRHRRRARVQVVRIPT